MQRRILLALLPALLFCVPAPAQGETVLEYWAVIDSLSSLIRHETPPAGTAKKANEAT